MTLMLMRMSQKYNVYSTKAGFKPDQPRNPDGTWGTGSGFSDKLLKLSELPKAPPHKTDKHGRIIEGKVHLYHSTNGLENLNDIVNNGVNLDKQTAVQGLFFAKLGSPYRKHDSFVVLEMDINDVSWGQRFMDSEVAFGRIENYEIVHASTLSPENLRTIKSLHKIFEKRGLKGLEKALDSYDKYEGEGNEVSKAVRGLISEEKKSAVFVKAGFNPNQTRDSDGKWSTKPGSLKDRPCFKEWFEGSKVVDGNGEPREFFHGTTHDFNEFSKERGNIENDFGIGFYFSSDESDVVSNYDDLDGADLRMRIARRMEEIMLGEDWTPELSNAARAQATSEMSGGESRVIPVYLSVKNPVVVGSPVFHAEEQETQFTYEYNYETSEESGNIIELADALRSVAWDYENVQIQTVISDAIQASEFNSGASAVISAMRHSDGLVYATDGNGNLAGHEIIRAAFEEMGFDGIIDNTVWNKFGRPGTNMKGLDEMTQHVIAFEPGSVKRSDAKSFCHETDIRKSGAVLIDHKAGFKEDQARDRSGKWTSKLDADFTWTDEDEAELQKQKEKDKLEKEKLKAQSMDEFEQRIKVNNFETAGIFDENGNLIFEKKGGRSSVQFSREEQKRMFNAVLTHNHPGLSSFSHNDIRFLMSTGLNEIRAINSEGDIFVMKQIAEYSEVWEKFRKSPIQALARSFEEATAKVQKLTNLKIRELSKGEDGFSEALVNKISRLSGEESHLIWEEVANSRFGRFALEYTKK